MNESERVVSQRVIDVCRSFLKSFAQTVKLISLYKASHPIPLSAQQQSWQLLQDLLTESGWTQVTFSMTGGRWVANEQVVADSEHAYELLAVVFRCHALISLTFLSECRIFEFAALCQLASTPPNRAYQTDAEHFLKEQGCRHIQANVEEFVRQRRVHLPASAIVQNPLAALSAPVPKPESAKAEPGQGFGSFIKSLVDQAVDDPRERVKIYSEAVRHVRQALARHVSEATHRLLLEKQGVVNERMRAESVLTCVGDGKVVVDQNGRVLMMDTAAEQIVGRPLADVVGKQILESLETGEQFVALSKDLVLPSNRPISEEMQTSGGPEVLSAFRQSVAVVHDEQGRVVGTCAVLPHAAKFRETQKMQDDFVANVTHDLKAPLTSICSALEVLNRELGTRLKEEEAEFLDICVRNSQTLREMIDELLDFSKIRSGQMTLNASSTAVEPLLNECVETLTPWARAKKLRLEVDSSDVLREHASVLADRRRVLQILNNLISNAIKATPEGGRVSVSALRGEANHAGHIVLLVADTGCGVSVADQPHIFERFTQGSNGQRQGGVGLGLAIAHDLVTLHRGQLWLESEPGRGSTFFFSLPEVSPSQSGSEERS